MLADAHVALAWLTGGAGAAPRFAVVVAHPDDETLGAGAHLDRLAGARFVHVTDGAPRDGADARAAGFADVGAYARARRQEALRALADAGVPAERAVALGVPDQRATQALADVAAQLAGRFREHQIGAVLTHAYEGGHPDHDATACAVHAAAALLGGDRAPALLELAGYHAGGEGGARVVGRFLPQPSAREITVALTPAQIARKRERLAAHATQAAVIEDLVSGSPLLVEERFRTAPAYDFARAPHEGRLHFERFCWGIDGAGWRAAAVRALGSLGLPSAPRGRG